jgi:hypothetical protein
LTLNRNNGKSEEWDGDRLIFIEIFVFRAEDSSRERMLLVINEFGKLKGEEGTPHAGRFNSVGEGNLQIEGKNETNQSNEIGACGGRRLPRLVDLRNGSASGQT